MTRPSAIAAAALLVAAAFAGNAVAMSKDAASAQACAEQPVHVCNQRIVEATFAQWQAGGNDFFQTLLSPEVVWTIEGSGPSAGSLRGRAALIATAVRPLAGRAPGPATAAGALAVCAVGHVWCGCRPLPAAHVQSTLAFRLQRLDQHCRLRAAVAVELFQDRGDVHLDGVFGQAQFVRNLLVE